MKFFVFAFVAIAAVAVSVTAKPQNEDTTGASSGGTCDASLITDSVTSALSNLPIESLTSGLTGLSIPGIEAVDLFKPVTSIVDHTTGILSDVFELVCLIVNMLTGLLGGGLTGGLPVTVPSLPGVPGLPI